MYLPAMAVKNLLFLLRGAPLDAAIQLAERVRQEVEAHTFTYDDVDLKITISLGVAHWSGEDPMTGEELVEAADRRLYEAKEGGRNRVCHDPVQQAEPH